MDSIIKKAIAGGFKTWTKISDEEIVLDPLFWQALGKACGWEGKRCSACHQIAPHPRHASCDGGWLLEEAWLHNALLFHAKNLTESFQKAVEYLKEVTN